MAYVKFNIWFRKNKHYTELFITRGEKPEGSGWWCREMLRKDEHFKRLTAMIPADEIYDLDHGRDVLDLIKYMNTWK